MMIFVNQGWRPADELVTVGNEVLVEYEMPKGTTAMQIFTAADWEAHTACKPNLRSAANGRYYDVPCPHSGRSVSYTKCPKRFTEAMKAEGVEWAGVSQTHRRVLIYGAR